MQPMGFLKLYGNNKKGSLTINNSNESEQNNNKCQLFIFNAYLAMSLPYALLKLFLLVIRTADYTVRAVKS